MRGSAHDLPESHWGLLLAAVAGCVTRLGHTSRCHETNRNCWAGWDVIVVEEEGKVQKEYRERVQMRVDYYCSLVLVTKIDLGSFLHDRIPIRWER